MIWKEIDPDNLPKGEVLAACFDPDSKSCDQKEYGWICRTKSGVIQCDDGENYVEGVTHYMETPPLQNEVDDNFPVAMETNLLTVENLRDFLNKLPGDMRIISNIAIGYDKFIAQVDNGELEIGFYGGKW